MTTRRKIILYAAPILVMLAVTACSVARMRRAQDAERARPGHTPSSQVEPRPAKQRGAYRYPARIRLPPPGPRLPPPPGRLDLPPETHPPRRGETSPSPPG